MATSRLRCASRASALRAKICCSVVVRSDLPRPRMENQFMSQMHSYLRVHDLRYTAACLCWERSRPGHRPALARARVDRHHEHLPASPAPHATPMDADLLFLQMFSAWPDRTAASLRLRHDADDRDLSDMTRQASATCRLPPRGRGDRCRGSGRPPRSGATSSDTARLRRESAVECWPPKRSDDLPDGSMRTCPCRSKGL